MLERLFRHDFAHAHTLLEERRTMIDASPNVKRHLVRHFPNRSNMNSCHRDGVFPAVISV